MSGEHLTDAITLHCGDSRVELRNLADASIDSVITDPPYALVSIGKRFGKDAAAPCRVPEGGSGAYARASAGFMGKKWDTGETAFDPEFWVEVLRVLKPGGHVVAFGGTRSGHRLACAIEDAGLEIRDCLGWAFGQGFPKSLNVTEKLIHSLPADAQCVCARDCQKTAQGFQSDYPSCHDFGDGRPHQNEETSPDILPSQSDVPSHNRGDLNWGDPVAKQANIFAGGAIARPSNEDWQSLSARHLGSSQKTGNVDPDTASNTSPVLSTVEHKTGPRKPGRRNSVGGGEGSSWQDSHLPQCIECGKLVVPNGLGTALKPSWKMIYLARKPLIGTVAENVLKHGTGAINIDGCRVGTSNNLGGGRLKGATKVGDGWDRPWMHDEARRKADAEKMAQKVATAETLGRWPANLVHDGSPEVLACLPETATGFRPKQSTAESKGGVIYGDGLRKQGAKPYDDSGSAARFFYCAKASKRDHAGSKHPTVKPINLMRWLVRLVTPPGGLVLDHPFAGSGTTGEAASLEGMRCVLIEREDEYQQDIRNRIASMQAPAAPKQHDSLAPVQGAFDL